MELPEIGFQIIPYIGSIFQPITKDKLIDLIYFK